MTSRHRTSLARPVLFLQSTATLSTGRSKSRLSPPEVPSRSSTPACSRSQRTLLLHWSRSIQVLCGKPDPPPRGHRHRDLYIYTYDVCICVCGLYREIHWHPTSDEWGFFLAGKARATIYAATANSRSFDYHVGDVSYIEHAMSHYIENTGDEDVVLLEVLQAERFTDISLGQWMVSTQRSLPSPNLQCTSDHTYTCTHRP